MLSTAEHLEKLRHYTPFDSGSQKFKLSFLDDYLLPLAGWLERPDKAVLLAQESNSSWETAISSEVLLKTLTFAKAHRPDWFGANRERIADKIANAVPWLLERAQRVQIDPEHEGLTWETVTWDTSTVARALLAMRRSPHLEFSDDRAREIDEAVAKSLIWQARMIKNWSSEGKYAFAAADIALVAMCFISVIRQQDALGRQLVEDPLLKQESLALLLSDCVDILLNWGQPVPLSSSDPGGVNLRHCWWSDYFATAEVLEALASYHAIACLPVSSWKKGDDPFCQFDQHALSEQIARIRECVAGGMYFFGASQVNGMWGSHVDTLRALNCYLSVGTKIRKQSETRPGLEVAHYNFEPEIDVAFKAIRFVCDYKQFFADKSYQHSVYLSVFCAMTFATLFEDWAPAELPTTVLYDEVVWAAPTRAEETTSLLARAQLENERQALRLNQKIERLTSANRGLHAQATRRLRANRRIVAGLVVFSITIAILIQLELILVGWGARFDESAVSAVVASASLIYAVLVFAINAVTRGEDKDEEP